MFFPLASRHKWVYIPPLACRRQSICSPQLMYAVYSLPIQLWKCQLRCLLLLHVPSLFLRESTRTWRWQRNFVLIGRNLYERESRLLAYREQIYPQLFIYIKLLSLAVRILIAPEKKFSPGTKPMVLKVGSMS